MEARTANHAATDDVFSVSRRHLGGSVVLELRGELDLAATEELEDQLAIALGSDADEVVLNLEDVSFIDSSGIESLMRAKRSSSEAEKLRISPAGSHQVERMLQMTGVLPLLAR